jgi:hypothetical protein
MDLNHEEMHLPDSKDELEDMAVVDEKRMDTSWSEQADALPFEWAENPS